MLNHKHLLIVVVVSVLGVVLYLEKRKKSPSDARLKPHSPSKKKDSKTDSLSERRDSHLSNPHSEILSHSDHHSTFADPVMLGSTPRGSYAPQDLYLM